MHLLTLMSVVCPTGRLRGVLGHAGQGRGVSAVTDPSAPFGVSPGTSHGDALAARLCRAAPRACAPLRRVQDQALMVSPPSWYSLRGEPEAGRAHGVERGIVLSLERRQVPFPSPQTHWKWLVRFLLLLALCPSRRAASAEQGTRGWGRSRGAVGESIPKKRESRRHSRGFAPPCAMCP